MILFFNLFITKKRREGHPNTADTLDIFKYALASYACWDRINEVIIFCELDNDFKHRESELREYIDKIFNGKKITFYNYSLQIQSEWQKALENSPLLTTDDLIMYSGNHDHIFTDYELNGLYEGLDIINQWPKDQINTLHFTSWPESISLIYNFSKRAVPFKEHNLFWESEMLIADAIQIVNNVFFQHVFFGLEDMGNTFVRRTDSILCGWYPVLGNHKFKSKKEHPKVKRLTPLREMGRHFDTYFHVQMPLSYCPFLKIPDGFFQDDIKINYCNGRKNKFYNIDPVSKHYFSAGVSDAPDDRKMIEDIPYFWKNKISEVLDKSEKYIREELLTGRNLAHKEVMTAPHCRHWQTPEHTYNRAELDLEEKYIKIGYRNQ